MAGLFPLVQKFDPSVGVDSNIDVHEAPPSALDDMKNCLALNQGEVVVRDGFKQLFYTLPRNIIAWNWGIFRINDSIRIIGIGPDPVSPNPVSPDTELLPPVAYRVYLFRLPHNRETRRTYSFGLVLPMRSA